MAPQTGAALIARTLRELGMKVIFGLVGISVVQIAEEAIALGIRFVAFRNEQAASYAATAYGYLTGQPGVCLVVGGPGVLHAMAGVGNASANAFPLLLLAGSSETHLGRGGPAFVDIPADVIQGRGAAYAQAQVVIRKLINQTNIPFLPTPMGKAVPPDSHPSNAASARSVALKGADVVLVLGARLNWVLHYGEEPKWDAKVKIIQVDISAEELGKNNADPALGIIGDINVVVSQSSHALGNWQYNTSSQYARAIKSSKVKNEANAAKTAKRDSMPMNYARTFNVIKETLHKLAPPEGGGIVYVSEGANTMDISRSVFPVEYPRLRLDAGTYATMGVGMGYAIATHCAYNLPSPEASSGPSSFRKKIVCLEGDSAFDFSLAEVETMSRYGMDILIFVINNGGVYHGDSEDSDVCLKMRQKTIEGSPQGGLRSSSLGWEVGYEKIADMCGGKGYLVRTPEELARVTEEVSKRKSL
ncbi:hypothetical protein DL98DRAFT_556478 [Cadophora sp. DSE1049]|nr:hypothetical protein DL98DRAFT_556478 [Cadophora sp. DSE1049]